LLVSYELVIRDGYGTDVLELVTGIGVKLLADLSRLSATTLMIGMIILWRIASELRYTSNELSRLVIILLH